MRFFHGSSQQLAVGHELNGRGDSYAVDWGQTDFYSVLEQHRPKEVLPHKQAVFAVGHPDDIDLAGGATEWVFELEPLGPVSRHDLNWGSEISMLLSDGHTPDSHLVISAAGNYWSGLAHVNESVWEYLMPKAKILLVAPYETFQVNFEPGEEEWDPVAADTLRDYSRP